MLEAVDTAWLEGQRVTRAASVGTLHFSPAAGRKKTPTQITKKRENRDWHHPKYQMMWMENHAVDDAKEIDRMLNVLSGPLVWRKGPGCGFWWKTLFAFCIAFYCLLYCILLSTGFTVIKLYYVSILFYYASVFDFPKYKIFDIALCYGRKMLPWSITFFFFNLMMN